MTESTSPELESTAGLADEVVAAHQAEAASHPGVKLPDSLFWWMLTLAVPVLMEEGLNLMVGFTDQLLAGWFIGGNDPLAAMGLMMYGFWMLYCFFSAVSVGGTALTARFVGAGDLTKARQAVGQAVLAGTLLALVMTVFSAFAGDWFVHTLGLKGEAARLATRYIWYITPVIPLIMLEQVGSACLRGAGDTITGLFARAVVNVVNMILSTLLVTGSLGFPNLGWDGIAIGTATAHGFGGLIVLAAMCNGRRGIRLELRHLAPDWSMMKRLLRVGVPGGIDMLAIVFCHLLYYGIILSLGTAAAAAHGLSLRIEAMSFLAGSAFSVAAATMAGQLLGAGQPQRAKQAVALTCKAAMLVMFCAAVMFFFAGEQIAELFNGGKSDELTELCGQLLKIVAVSCVPLAILTVLSGAMRGAGDTRFTLIINILGIALVRLPLSAALGWQYIPVVGTDWYLYLAGWGVQGVWCGAVSDIIVRAAIFVWRYFQGGWLKAKV